MTPGGTTVTPSDGRQRAGRGGAVVPARTPSGVTQTMTTETDDLDRDELTTEEIATMLADLARYFYDEERAAHSSAKNTASDCGGAVFDMRKECYADAASEAMALADYLNGERDSLPTTIKHGMELADDDRGGA